MRNRRYLGVSFAVSHGFHLLAIVILAVGTAATFHRTTVVGGGIGFAFIVAMTATSFDRTATWLGPRYWKRLHTAGGYYLWLVFTFTYTGNARRSALSALGAALCWLALAFKLSVRARCQRWRHRADIAPPGKSFARVVGRHRYGEPAKGC
jgi:methionine sulfoxide reductase heme-binding subunit